MPNIVSTFQILLHHAVFYLSTCHSLTSTLFGFSWKTSKLERLQYSARVEPLQTRERQSGQGSMWMETEEWHLDSWIIDSLSNAFCTSQALPLLFLWDQLFSKCGNSGNKKNLSYNENWSWQLTLVLSFPLMSPLCLSLLLFALWPHDSSVSLSIMSVPYVHMWHASGHHDICHSNWFLKKFIFSIQQSQNQGLLSCFFFYKQIHLI